MPLLIALLALPLIEIAGFVLVGGWLGLWATLGLVLLSAIAGVVVFQIAGRSMAARVSQAIDRQAPPMAELFHGFCLVAAAILLIIPGFFTDLAALLLLLPPLRNVLGLVLWRFAAARRRPDIRRSTVIDGEFEDITPAANRSATRPPNSAPSANPHDPPANRPLIQPNRPPNPSSPWRKD
ncbi:MAG: FxsA family protein [Alphaproteobacteria bacterium]